MKSIYNVILNKIKQNNYFFEAVKNKEYGRLDLIKKFANKLELNIDDELYYVLVVRLFSLREDNLKKYLQKKSFNEDKIDAILEKAYEFVSDFWLDEFKDILLQIKKQNLLDEFYLTILEAMFEVGIEFNKWQIVWQKHIIKTINKELFEIFKDDKKVIEFLRENHLFDIGHNELIADRCYSVIVKNSDDLEVQSYATFFKKEVSNIVKKLENLQNKLIEIEDTKYNQKWQWYRYIQSLIKAFGEVRREYLVKYWAEVDKAWMDITTPIQVAHPLEYYEDKYRKAVALELDVRVSKDDANLDRIDKIKNMFYKIYDELDYKDDNIFKFSLNSLNKTQIYISLPLMFFGSELNGLFSAQVVPNDEVVSKQMGKKIFAYADMILANEKAKPTLKITTEFFEKEFLDEYKDLLKDDKKWHKIYDISTIGHELGHILWCDEESESVMNKSGNFKNIEEFKATTAGIVSFFVDKSEFSLSRYLVNDIIKRAVSLIAWMEVDEVKPYYSEGLIHLYILKKSEIVDFSKEKLQIDYTKIDNLSSLYIDIYKKLAIIYLKKIDAWEFLKEFIEICDNKFYPKDKQLNDFVKRYYNRYLEIGNEIV